MNSKTEIEMLSNKIRIREIEIEEMRERIDYIGSESYNDAPISFEKCRYCDVMILAGSTCHCQDGSIGEYSYGVISRVI